MSGKGSRQEEGKGGGINDDEKGNVRGWEV